jgi:hypothetical protein
MPAPQYNEGADNRCDDAGSLTRAIQVNRAAEKSRHDTSDNSQYSRQDESLRVVGGRRNPSSDEACDSPNDDCPDDLHVLVLCVWEVTIAHEWVGTDWRQDPRIPSSRLVISAPSEGRAALPTLPMQPPAQMVPEQSLSRWLTAPAAAGASVRLSLVAGDTGNGWP